MTQELYPWQRECLDNWERNNYHGIVNAITGAGKTRMALAGIQHLKAVYGSKLRIKIVLPGKSLLGQWKKALHQTLSSETEIGICGGGYKSTSEKPYMLYVINSARYCLARQILQELREGCTVLLIADECHNYTSRENCKIFEFLPYVQKSPGIYCSLGLSATAAKTGYESVLIPALGKEIYHYNLIDALQKGTICEFAIWQIAIHFQENEREEYESLSDALIRTHRELLLRFPGLKYCQGASFFAQLKELLQQKDKKGSRLAKTYLQLSYKRKRIVHMANERTSCVYHLLKHLGLKKQIIIFGESISQINHLYEILNQSYPQKIGRYHSKMGTCANQNALQRFRSGELRILLTCRALDEGIDLPEASVGIILSGTSMERQRLQRLGRILRKHNKKRMACLYYLFLADSQEEHAYFPQRKEGFRVLDLWYREKDGSFYFPDYEKAAALVLSDCETTDIYDEVLACLQHGYLREDWLLPPEECRQNALASTGIRMQNYWLCMEKMSDYKTM